MSAGPRRLWLEQRSGSTSGQRHRHVRSRRPAVHLVRHQRDVEARFRLPIWGGGRSDDHAQSEPELFDYTAVGERSPRPPSEASVSSRRDTRSTGESTGNMFFLQPGIERKWNSLGKTNIFGEYRRDDSALRRRSHDCGQRRHLAVGRQPGLDNADMTLYVVYRNSSGDVLGNRALRRQYRAAWQDRTRGFPGRR